jgi:beta-glucanase (GH16 family)
MATPALSVEAHYRLDLRDRMARRARTAARLALCLLSLAAGAVAAGAQRSTMPLIDLNGAGATKRITVSTPGEVSFGRADGGSGIVVTCRPGKDAYPGITVKPEGAVWDLSEFGYVQARVTNIGAAPVTVCLRVDDDGDWTTNPWNAENAALAAGETGVVRVRFGYSWGKPGFALHPARIARLLLFTSKPQSAQTFRVGAIEAGGRPGDKPPVNPADVRIKPAGGVLFDKGVASTETRAEAIDGDARIAPRSSGDALRVTLPGGADAAAVRLQPAAGRWDLRDWLEVVVRARNRGAAPVRLKARLESAPGISDWVTAPAAMAPGAEQEIALPFAGSLIRLAAKGEPQGGSAFESDRASGISISAAGEGERVLEVESVSARMPPPPKVPVWLGKRPPVPGAWKQTLDQEFNGPTLDESVWTVYHPNYWDKSAHFSKQNVILGGGLLRLRFEKKRGHADDDPSKPETDWATGFITSTHKWTQRYGYFECRMKLPRAPGMWPAFWMMPDRGPAAGAAREDTRDGGMEFDILEYLSRYGPYRYNIACHWDGYDKDHKSNGTDHIYVQPDKDGFYTAGLLWEPGKATFYCNGAPVAVWEDPRVASVPEYILFTAVSGGWGGNDLTGEGLPDDLVLDYVRAWKRSEPVAGNSR